MLWFKQDLTLAWIGKQWKYRELGRFKMGRKKTSMMDSNISFMQLDDLTEEALEEKKKKKSGLQMTTRHLSLDVLNLR